MPLASPLDGEFPGKENLSLAYLSCPFVCPSGLAGPCTHGSSSHPLDLRDYWVSAPGQVLARVLVVPRETGNG